MSVWTLADRRLCPTPFTGCKISTATTLLITKNSFLPQGTIISNITLSQGSSAPFAVNCAQIIYAAPFGRMYVYWRNDNLCGDVIVTNNILQNPSLLLAMSDIKVTITLKDSPSAAVKTVLVKGVTGTIETP